MGALRFIARHGRWSLIAGLVAGLALPGMAQWIKPWLPEMIAALLFVAAFRIGPRAALGNLRDLRHTLRIALIYQLAAPLLVLGLAAGLGALNSTAMLAVILVLASPSVTGSPNFTLLMGQDPSAAMRLLLLGTAVFPFTALPVLLCYPPFGAPAAVVLSSLKLLAVVFGAVGAAFALRHLAGDRVTPDRQQAFDGAAAILLAVMVVGLMSVAGPVLKTDPARFARWLGFALTLNFGLQLLAWRFLPGISARDLPGISVVAGNRNIALFLVALPESTIDQLLLFIGCYQIPMYLTPTVMKFLHDRPKGRASAAP